MTGEFRSPKEPSREVTDITDITVVLASESADDSIIQVTGVSSSADNLPADQEMDVVPYVGDFEINIQTHNPLASARRKLCSPPQSPLIRVDMPLIRVDMPPPLQPTAIRRKTRYRTIDWKRPPPTPPRQSARIAIRRNTEAVRPPSQPTTIKKPPKPKVNPAKVVGE